MVKYRMSKYTENNVGTLVVGVAEMISDIPMTIEAKLRFFKTGLFVGKALIIKCSQ